LVSLAFPLKPSQMIAKIPPKHSPNIPKNIPKHPPKRPPKQKNTDLTKIKDSLFLYVFRAKFP